MLTMPPPPASTISRATRRCTEHLTQVGPQRRGPTPSAPSRAATGDPTGVVDQDRRPASAATVEAGAADLVECVGGATSRPPRRQPDRRTRHAPRSPRAPNATGPGDNARCQHPTGHHRHPGPSQRHRIRRELHRSSPRVPPVEPGADQGDEDLGLRTSRSSRPRRGSGAPAASPAQVTPSTPRGRRAPRGGHRRRSRRRPGHPPGSRS